MRSMQANRVRNLRERRGITQRQLAAEMSVHESTISRWEAGISPIPDAMKVRLAQFFGCPVAWLMGWDTPADDNRNGQRESA